MAFSVYYRLMSWNVPFVISRFSINVVLTLDYRIVIHAALFQQVSVLSIVVSATIAVQSPCSIYNVDIYGFKFVYVNRLFVL